MEEFTKTFRVTEDLYASQGIRFANYLLDFLFQFIIGAAIGAIIGFIGYYTDNSDIIYFFEDMNRFEEYIFGIIVLIIYYNLTEIFLSRSIGKFITKTIVVMEDGSKPDAKTILKRTICRVIPFNHFSFLGSPSRGWHDSLSETYVVKKEELEEKMNLFYSFEEIGKTEE